MHPVVGGQGDATRFPSGMKALGDYMHAKGAQFALYTAENTGR
jgi:alpha-galactosidase